MVRKVRLALTLAVVTTLVGCNEWKRQSIASQIKDLTQQQELANKKLTDRNQAISFLQNESSKLAGKLRARRSEVLEYLSNHKLAVGCMAATGYILNGENVFSKDVDEMIAGGALICGGMILFSDSFRQEIDDVIAELEQADVDVKSFQSQIDSIKPKMEAETSALASETAELDALTEKIRGLQSELDKLK